MEVSGVRYRHVTGLSGAGFRRCSYAHRGASGPSSVAFYGKRPFSGKRMLCEGSSGRSCLSGFSDDGYVRYYSSPVSGAKKEKKEKKEEAKAIKKRLKLIKVLSKDLSAFSGMGFGLEQEAGLAGEVKGRTIAEAADVLMAQLQQLKAEEKEMKRKKKAEKATMKAARMKSTVADEDSSSSSSESSDSECGEVVNMSQLRKGVLAETKTEQPQDIPIQATVERLEAILARDSPATEYSGNEPKDLSTHSNAEQPEAIVKSDSLSASARVDQPGLFLGTGLLADPRIDPPLLAQEQPLEIVSKEIGCNGGCGNDKVMVGSSAERIEVCMGGKCKKSGAPALLEEFVRKAGASVDVVGCNCMGKCRNAPNVRVMNKSAGDGSPELRATNPLCIGVALEDVDMILANFFGQQRDVGRGLVAV